MLQPINSGKSTGDKDGYESGSGFTFLTKTRDII